MREGGRKRTVADGNQEQEGRDANEQQVPRQRESEDHTAQEVASRREGLATGHTERGDDSCRVLADGC